MNTKLTPWISIIISAIAAFISLSAFLLTFFRNRKRIIQIRKVDKHSYIPISEGQIIVQGNDDTSGEPVLEGLPSGLLLQLSFLNPSPTDIAFFNVGFYGKDKLIEAYTEKSVDFTFHPTFIYTDAETKRAGEITFPHRPFGKFPANSYTALGFFMPIRQLDTIPKNIKFRLCYAVKSFPYFGKGSNYKVMSIKLDLSSIRTEIINQGILLRNSIKMSDYTSPSHDIPKNNLFDNLKIKIKNLFHSDFKKDR